MPLLLLLTRDGMVTARPALATYPLESTAGHGQPDTLDMRSMADIEPRRAWRRSHDNLRAEVSRHSGGPR